MKNLLEIVNNITKVARGDVNMVLLRISVFVFFIALTQDAYYVDGPEPKAWSCSLGLFCFGWLGVLFGYYAWLANPLLLASWYLQSKGSYCWGALYSVVSVIVMLSFLLYKSIVTPILLKITWHGPGYWFWVVSGILSLVNCLIAIIRRKWLVE
jgi:hypothetical protein